MMPRRGIQALVGAMLVAVLAGLTLTRNTVWHNGIALWEDAAAKSPRDPGVLFNLALEYHAAGRVPEALEIIRSLLPSQKSNWLVVSELSSLLADIGMLDEAMRWSDRAVMLNPEAAEAWTARGNIHQRRRQWVLAKKAYERAIAFSPLAYVALNNLANTYDELEQENDAERTYQAIIWNYPEAPEGYYNYGVFHERRGDSASALNMYRMALQRRHDYGEAMDRIAILQGVVAIEPRPKVEP